MDSQPEFPVLKIDFAPAGILLIYMTSAFHSETLLIPNENAAAMCAGWIARLSQTDRVQLMQVVRSVVKENETMKSVVRSLQ